MGFFDFLKSLPGKVWSGIKSIPGKLADAARWTIGKVQPALSGMVGAASNMLPIMSAVNPEAGAMLGVGANSLHAINSGLGGISSMLGG